MLVFGSAALFVFIGVVLIVKRRELAHLQALLAGGTIPPGCAVFEGIVMLLLAALVFVAGRAGWIAR